MQIHPTLKAMLLTRPLKIRESNYAILKTK